MGCGSAEHQVLVAIGVDGEGGKHVLGLADGPSENQVVAKGLLEDLVRRGVKPDRRRLFVIDGSKALRAAIDAVFGKQKPVQRCRRHKIENVMGYLSPCENTTLILLAIEISVPWRSVLPGR